ncbi:MAG: hypothetical protein N0A15_06905 [Anaerolineae bacterium]|nr:hypothetical protein [Anaerolineae bacterium]
MRLLREVIQGEASITPALAGRMLEEFRRLSRLMPPEAGEEFIMLTHRGQ